MQAKTHLFAVLLMALFGSSLLAQEAPGPSPSPGKERFDAATVQLRNQLDAAVLELTELRRRIADEKIALSGDVSKLESELLEVRAEQRRVARGADSQAQKLSNLKTKIEGQKTAVAYFSRLFSVYVGKFDASLHIAEKQRYADLLDRTQLVMDDEKADTNLVLEQQAELLSASLDRLAGLAGGSTFKGEAVTTEGVVAEGRIVLVGPAAVFRSDDGDFVGTAELGPNKLLPTQVGFGVSADADAAADMIKSLDGSFLFDPTGGNAHKIAATEETLIEHVKKGGAVMVPIAAMAGLALLVALFKLVTLLLTRKPSRRSLERLLEALRIGDRAGAEERVRRVAGPAGKMLQRGVANLDQPRDLIEEVMYEQVLATKLRVNSLLPFIAICAASAPLLGLLGTVTGIISTFELITVLGSGDVQSLSGGISEALITTKFGLIVAIPSLLLHAFLSRMARGVLDQMEKSGLAFINETSRVENSKLALREAVQPTDPIPTPEPEPKLDGPTIASLSQAH